MSGSSCAAIKFNLWKKKDGEPANALAYAL